MENPIGNLEFNQQSLSERLTLVLDAINALSKIESFDALCHRSMDLAIKRLGFDRIGLCFLSEDRKNVLGVYGTDETGHLRNEKHLKRSVEGTPTVKKLLESRESVLFFEREALTNDKLEQIGVGNHAVARLWNGEEVIGILAVDNLIHRKPITEQDIKILDVYATALGHLCTLKKTEDALRESENRFRALFEQAAVGVAQIETGSGKFLKTNRRFCTIVGYTAEALLNRSLSGLTHPTDLKTEQKMWRSIQPGESREYSLDKRLRHQDGWFVWVNQTISTMRTADGGSANDIVIIQDITERKRMEDQIKADIQEKSILLQEVHHRVKNNMQIIISLLNLQAFRINDPTQLQYFKASKERIHSMALVHEMLYRSRDLAKIDFSKYIERLVNTLFHSFGADPRRIHLELDLEPIPLKVEYAVPCGLIVQELVSNALKYAFPKGWKGKPKIRVGFWRIDNKIELLVADNGRGMEGKADTSGTTSLGLRLVHLLGKEQLGGSIRINRKGGMRIALRFKETKD